VLLFSIKPRYFQADTLSAKAVPIELLAFLSAGLETLLRPAYQQAGFHLGAWNLSRKKERVEMGKKIIITLIIFASILLILVVGCGKTQNPIEQQNSKISRISIIPEEIALAPNGFQQFCAILYDSSNNDITTKESVTLNWDVSGSVGAITLSGTFTATAVGDGQVFASVGGVKGTANIKVVDGTPPNDFNLIITSNEVITSTETYAVSWTASGSKYNTLQEYEILGCYVNQWNKDDYGVLKKSIGPTATSAVVDLMLDGIWKLKVRAVDTKGLWRDSDGTSAAGSVGDPSRLLTVLRDTVPPGIFTIGNVYNVRYFDNPTDPIMWNSASDDNLDRYEITICTDPNDIFGTSVRSSTLLAKETSFEVNLPTGYYYVYLVAYDKAGHYRTIKGKTDIPARDQDLSYSFGLPVFGINGSSLNFVTKWGSEGSQEAQFKWPKGVALDDGYVYVADSGNSRVQKFDSDGNFVSSWGCEGFDVAVDNDPDGYGYVYVAGNERVYIFNKDGSPVINWPTIVSGETFSSLGGIAVDNHRNVYVTDYSNHNVKKFTLGGILQSKWGSEGTADGQFDRPAGITIDSDGNLYVVDRNLACVQKFDSSGNLITKWGTKLKLEQYSTPLGIDVDSNGAIWVADFDSHSIKKYDNNGNLKLKWGHNGMYGPDDNLYFYCVMDVAVDNNGNIFLTEDQRHRVQKFKE